MLRHIADGCCPAAPTPRLASSAAARDARRIKLALLWPGSQTLTPHSHLSRPRGAKSTHFHSSKNMCPTPQYLAQEGEMGAPGGVLKQCAQGRGQDRTCGVSPHMPKATFPFVTARQWVDGWRLFFLNTATVSAGHSQPCSRYGRLIDLRLTGFYASKTLARLIVRNLLRFA